MVTQRHGQAQCARDQVGLPTDVCPNPSPSCGGQTRATTAFTELPGGGSYLGLLHTDT